ncbi:DoxX family protein [Arenibaculum sp.]|jgi:putative oxidoreductase|uniref:DoxX family protein n=1 Tax=Arenibaculum sp. TaxID=2865862 RepID=UPI002E14B292|nr:DoxX family protein [Arenibaculum sp.]
MSETRPEIQAASYAALVLRLALGVMFLAHGLTKVLVFTPAGTEAFFASLGLPPFLAYLTMLAEVGGGLLLILGVQVRWVALAQLPILLGATVVHAGNGWGFGNPGGGWEYPAFLAAAQVSLILLGDGALALMPSYRPERARLRTA